MKNRRSLLATTAIAVFGLVAAAQSLHSHVRNAGPAVTAASVPGPVAWIDPPARAGGAETTGALAARPSAPDVLPVALAAPAEPVRKAAAAHRGRVAEKRAERARLRVARLRHPARTAAVDPAALPQSEARPTSAASGRIDPIGDILRGLGFGRDS